MAKSDVEIDEIKGELREWLDEKGVIGGDWYEVMWGVLVDDYVENELGDWKNWGDMMREIKKRMIGEIERRLGE